MNILYTFIRCPYAIRARLALCHSQVSYEHREVDLKNKPKHLLQVSPKGTVPVLITDDQRVIEQSLDIMRWALQQNDPQGWLAYPEEIRAQMEKMILTNDQEFKDHLNRYKYPERFPDTINQSHHQKQCLDLLAPLEQRLQNQTYLFGEKISFADLAIFPFARQFAKVDFAWFEAAGYNGLQGWIKTISNSELFKKVMQKYPL